MSLYTVIVSFLKHEREQPVNFFHYPFLGCLHECYMIVCERSITVFDRFVSFLRPVMKRFLKVSGLKKVTNGRKRSQNFIER